jgi:hypothetical protein
MFQHKFQDVKVPHRRTIDEVGNILIQKELLLDRTQIGMQSTYW